MSIVPLSPWLAHRPRRGAITTDTVVLHASDQTDVDELVRALRTEEHSYHYIVDPDGVIPKCVPFSAVAFHCQNSYGPHEALRHVSSERDGHGGFMEHTCVNEYTIGVCLIHDGGGTAAYPKAQTDACAALLKDLKTPLPKLRYVTTHAAVSPNRATDPEGFDVAAFAVAAELEAWFPEAAYA